METLGSNNPARPTGPARPPTKPVIRRTNASNAMNFFSAQNLEKMEKMIDQTLHDRTTMLLSEFDHYRPLYQRNSGHLSDRDYYRLSNEFQARVSIFHPLRIIADNPNPDGLHTILFTLPPIFTQIPQLESKFAEVPTVFSNILNRPVNPLSSDAERATDLMIAAIEAGKKPDSPEIKQLQAEYNAIMSKLDPSAPVVTATIQKPAVPDKPASILDDGDGWDPV